MPKIFVVCLVLLGTEVSGAIIHVPDQYSSIQDAINAAAPGDTVLVDPGWYDENISYAKNIFLIGRKGSDYTTISAAANLPAITCNVGSAGTIQGFTIRDGHGYFNGDAEYGGGIFCFSNNLHIKHNIITANTAQFGAGISTFWSAHIENNTIVGNQASVGGAGIHYYYFAMPQIENNIIVNNTGGGVYNEDWDLDNAYIAYNDIWNNGENYQYCRPDTGSISLEPAFVNAPIGNYHLNISSPCIDAGDPNFPRDPDNTRADMGAFYFDQSITPSIELYAHDLPIVIPAHGGTLEYDTWVYNLADTSVTVDIWTYVILPDQSLYGPVHWRERISINPQSCIGMNNMYELIPAYAPAGNYAYIGYVGVFSTSWTWDSDSIAFEKLPGDDGTANDRKKIESERYDCEENFSS